MSWMKYVARRSRTSILLFSLLLVAVLGVADYSTGPEISFSIFYLIPISLVSWFVGVPAGVFTSALAAFAFLTDSVGRATFSHATIPYWNAVARLGFFIIVVLTLSSLRSATRRREELSQFVVHDLRSPLTNVMTGLEILHEDEEGRLSREQKGFVEECMVSCKRMLTLVNSLLDLPRLEQRRLPLKVDTVGARALCKAALSQVRLWAMQKSITIVELYPPEDVRVSADFGITVRVLENVLGNAVKFADEGSRIVLRVYLEDEEHVAFSIENQGGGEGSEALEHVSASDLDELVFGATSPRGRGQGLGLTFSKYAVEAQRGRIWLTSKNGEETTATFTLPLAEERSSSHAHETRHRWPAR